MAQHLLSRGAEEALFDRGVSRRGAQGDVTDRAAAETTIGGCDALSWARRAQQGIAGGCRAGVHPGRRAA